MHILLPGPTPIPVQVQQAMLTPMSDHRGSPFQSVQNEVLKRLADLFSAPSPAHIAVLPATGTGGLEAAVQNFFEPGDRVLAVQTGLFGQRFADVAQAHGIEVERLSFPWGSAFDVNVVMERAKGTRGILVTHNETSTGVENPLAELAEKFSGNNPRPLVIVDSISGVPALPLAVGHGIDVIVAASQKGFMCPPGLALVVLSDEAREQLKETRKGRFYFDLKPYLDGRLPYTPAISLWYGLKAALTLLDEEGSTARLARHRFLRDMTRTVAAAGGLELMVQDRWASPTVTALGLPDHLSPLELRRRLEARGLQIAGGLGPWHDRGIRIGHVGALDAIEVAGGLALLALEMPRPADALMALKSLEG